jgi:hypothetical protein
MIDGYAELYDVLSPDEKRERSEQASHEVWSAADRGPRWVLPSRARKKR